MNDSHGSDSTDGEPIFTKGASFTALEECVPNDDTSLSHGMTSLMDSSLTNDEAIREAQTSNNCTSLSNYEVEEDEIVPKDEYHTYPIDTSDLFAEIFDGKDKFESWEEFVMLFEEFQRSSRTVFKARNATCVNYVNEKRVTHKIPEKFVYQTVKMICVHYGAPTIKENSKKTHTRYVGLECEAFVKLSYRKGFLHITDMNVTHTNHPLEKAKRIDSLIRKIRPVSFNDELDLLIVQIVDQNKVFEHRKYELRWQATLIQVQDADRRLEYITIRMLKKRVQFLMDRYETNIGDDLPLSNDYLGIILHRIIQAKKRSQMEPYVPMKRGRKKKKVDDLPRKKHKAAESYEEYMNDKVKYLKNRNLPSIDDGYDDYDDDTGFFDNSLQEASSGSSETEREIAEFQNYWNTTRDADIRRLNIKEINLRREEKEMRLKELNFQHEKEQSENSYRQIFTDLLKYQYELLKQIKSVKEKEINDKKETTEYILLSNGEYEQYGNKSALAPL